MAFSPLRFVGAAAKGPCVHSTERDLPKVVVFVVPLKPNTVHGAAKLYGNCLSS